MKNNDDTSRTDEMSETQLDQLLAAANEELLDHIEATANPDRALMVIMSQEAPRSKAATVAIKRSPNQSPAAVIIGLRIYALDLTSDLACALNLASDVAHGFAKDHATARALDLACQRALHGLLVLARASDLARVHASDLARELGRATVLTRGLCRELDLSLTAARTLTRILTRASVLARILVRLLNRDQVDASGADLSDVEIDHVDALNGIIWTPQTTWPLSIADQVLAYSEEIRPGVYQVQLKTTLEKYVLTPS
jgi:hypothetical protein